jgi:hypothetical protein
MNAQEFIVNGHIQHATNPVADVENIHVFNLKTNKGTVSDKTGDFRLRVSLGDSLLLSSISYQKVTLVITLEHYVSKAVAIIVQDMTNELDEILLLPYSLSGNLTIDAKSLKGEPLYDAKYFNIPTQKKPVLTATERKLYTATSGGGLIPFDPIINALSGRTKKLKNHVAAEKTNAAIDKLKEVFPESFFREELKIADALFYDFLFFCEADPDFTNLIKRDKISLTAFLTEKAKRYTALQAEKPE